MWTYEDKPMEDGNVGPPCDKQALHNGKLQNTVATEGSSPKA